MIITNNNESGFTLLEILLVVAIIAILVTMAIPAITGTRHSSYELSAMRALHSVGAVEQAYYNAYGTYIRWDGLRGRNYIKPEFNTGGATDRGRIAKHYSVRVYIDGPITTPRGVRYTGFSVIAMPEDGFGLRHFRLSEDGTVEQRNEGAGWEIR